MESTILLNLSASSFFRKLIRRPRSHAVSLPGAAGGVFFLLILMFFSAHPLKAQTEVKTTAWRQGSFHVDRNGVIGRSDLGLVYGLRMDIPLS